jgi:polyphosphate kinase
LIDRETAHARRHRPARIIAKVNALLDQPVIEALYRAPDLYLGSADWMPRNLYERVEVMFPVKDIMLRERVIEILSNYLKDTAKSRMLHANGKYLRNFHGEARRASRNGTRFSVQDFFIEEPEAADPGGAESVRVPIAMSAD